MIRTVILAALALVCVASNAEARHRRVVVADPGCNVLWPCEGVISSPRGEMIARQVGIGSAQKVYRERRSMDFRGKIFDSKGRTIAFTPDPRAEIVSHPAGCPARLFCGCGAAVRVFGAPIRALWLAAAWFKFPRSAPAPGMVAVRSHHVFVLERHIEGKTWLAYDANSGHGLTRLHPRSIAGYVVVDPHG